MRLIRWSGAVPLAIAVALVGVFWVFYLDLAVERSIEYLGSELVGARVDVGKVNVRLVQGRVVVRQLEVANPDSPMRNLVDIREIVARVRIGPLLEKKLVLDTVAIRGVRFGTQRRKSGALQERGARTGVAYRRLASWVQRVEIPPLNLAGLKAVVNLEKLSPDSLRTLAEARRLKAAADSLEEHWREALSSLVSPGQLDSARRLAARLKEANLGTLGVVGAQGLWQSARALAAQLESSAARLKELEGEAGRAVALVEDRVRSLGEAREADYAYARRLVNLPRLDAPDLSTAIFGEVVLQRIRPILYWLEVAEGYLPPGLDPRRRPGPKRLRARGTTVEFPRKESYPRFLLRLGEVELEVPGAGAAAARYAARLEGLTTAPAVYGRPTRFLARWTSGDIQGLESRVRAVLDHTDRPPRDSVQFRLQGVSLPAITIAPLGALVALNRGNLGLDLFRTGGELDARLLVQAGSVTWSPVGGQSSFQGDPGAALGSEAWARALLWRAVSSLNAVEINARLAGPLAAPRFEIGSNVGEQISRALRREVGAEIDRAEQRLRVEVDRLVGEPMREAQARVAALRSRAEGEIQRQQIELQRVREELELQIREFARRVLPR